MSTNLDISLEEFRARISEALAEGGTQSLVRLTDEELAVLDPEETLVPKPHLEAMTPEQREWSLATALRSLVAREAVEIHNTEELNKALHGGPEVRIDMHVRMDIDLALTLRRTADRMLAIKQHTAVGTAYACVHLHDTDLMLVERITAGGMHLFTLANNTDDVVNLVQPLLDPLGVADRDGDIHRLDPSALEPGKVGPLTRVIDNSRVVGELVLLSDPPGPMMTTYATDRAVWAVFVEQPHAPDGITARRVSTATLSRQIVKMLTAGTTEVRDG